MTGFTLSLLDFSILAQFLFKSQSLFSFYFMYKVCFSTHFTALFFRVYDFYKIFFQNVKYLLKYL